MKISDRLAKLEARRGSHKPAGPVIRHVVHGRCNAERQAKATAILAAHSPRVFHIFRMIVSPGEEEVQRGQS